MNVLSLSPCNEPLQVQTPDGSKRILAFALLNPGGMSIIQTNVIGCVYLHAGEIKINLGGKISEYEWQAEANPS